MKRLLLAMLMLLACAWARADTPVTLFKSVAGNVNFVGGQVSLRRASNASDPCLVYTASDTVQLTIAGIPAAAVIKHAQLYWAGSGSTLDYTISMDGVSYTAPANRQYSSTTIGSGFTFFSGAIDVTAAVTTKRNGNYALTGLSVNNGSPWCASSGVQGGYSMVVVYSLPSEPFRVLNLYEGFQYLQYSSVTLTLSNFQIPSPIGSATGRVAHITWEGDDDLLATGESLKFNGTAMVDATNPGGNQFNSKSNITGTGVTSYGVDFDAYTVSSPVIASGQTQATTVYSTDQDLVLLSAEIIAIPNVAAADLEIFMTRNTALVNGSAASYTLTVKNNGPSVETGPMTVVNTLPAGLSFVAASGSGWSCSAVGQVVTCTSNSSLAVDATANAITLSVLVNGTGSMTNTATIDGATFDNISANSTVSDTATATAPVISAYVFTDKACTPNVAFGTAGQCVIYVWNDMVAGGVVPAVYITAVNGSNVPTPIAGSATNVPFEFGLSCHNPSTNNGVAAKFGVGAAITLPLCAASGAVPTTWSTATNMAFGAGAASTAALTFFYDDVGKIELHMRQTPARLAKSTVFTSRPYQLRLSSITAGTVTSPAAPDYTSPVFAKAGAPFNMTVGAYTTSGALAKNFGRETSAETFATTIDNPEGGFDGALSGAFGAISGGSASGSAFAWSEVGVLAVTPSLGNAATIYSGTPGVASKIGRFYPDHFNTVVTGPIGCATAMVCGTLTTAAYSKQPFTTVVSARNAADGITQNYQGNYAKTVNLSAFNAPDGTTQNPPAALPGTLTASAVAPGAFALGQSTVATPTPSYALQNAYLETANHANNWGTPTSIYLRAIEAAGGDSVTTRRGAATVEGGVRIVSGRLYVGNVHGSDRLPLTLPVKAQFWSGSAWELSSGDSSSTVNPATPAKMSFPACRGNCVPLVTPALASSAVRTLGAGVPVLPFKFSAPNGGGGASIEVLINDAVWLPSTRGRISYGVYRSPLIYFRDVF